ncbi:DUF389 domain-containing protein [Halostagnicola kamekurae]|uniref:Uncharacterized hydrophobic domain-containing protein n=1 Tax=Halostagnicola kamekurae TaxID=619731 RepID=A0A1I6Q4B6_9EURY|nr:DUF389 domain-containing protein [Halostagnicola kamekurae]SFS47316.1 uncharacterized hydrophobic domain-containing protein [Halostagnicola kamekurae]
MRSIELLVPEGKRERTLTFLEDEDIDYVRIDERGSAGELVEFPVPTEAVDRLLEHLREDIGIDEEYIVISSIETARTPRIDDLEDRFVNGEEADDSISRDEIRTRALNLTPSRVTYYTMTILSAIVATAGLLLDSPAIVVGSMVIAPQVSAALTGTVGLVINDRDMIVSGIRSLLLGLGVAVVGSFVVAWVIRVTGVVPSIVDIGAITQIQQRASPGVLGLVVGAAAGAAGAFGLATAIPVSLVGVMIAVALIPAAATVGVGLAWGAASIALGAAVLVVVNAMSILLSGLVVFWYLGYRPRDWTPGAVRSNLTFQRVGTVAIVVFVLAAVLAAGGFALTQHLTFQDAVSEEVQTVLEEDDDLADLELVSIGTEFDDHGIVSERTEVTIEIQRSAGREYPGLAETFAARISERTDRDVSVTVEFVDRRSSDTS